MLARKVLKNAIYNSSSILIGNLAGLVITIYVARVLKPELFGLYSLAISIAFFLLTFTDLGINASVTRYVAHAYGQNNPDLVRGYIRELGRIKLLLTLITSIGLFALSDYLAQNVFTKASLSVLLKLMSLYVFFYAFSGFISAIINGFNDFEANFVRSLSYEASRLVFVVTLVSIFSVVGALAGFVVAGFVSMLSLAFLLAKKYEWALKGKAEKINWKRVVRFTGYLTIGSITWTVYAYVDSIMIGIFLPAEAVGYYRAAYNIIGAIAGVLSIPAVLYPVFVNLEGKDLVNAFNRVFKYSSILAFPAVFGLIVIGEHLISFVYGHEYLPAVGVLSILSFLILGSALGFWAVLFNAKEMPEYPVYISFSGMLLNVALNYVLIQKMGIAGAAMATLASNALVWTIFAVLTIRIFRLKIDLLSNILKPLFSSALMAYVVMQFEFHSLIDAILKLIAGMAVYFVCLYAVRGFKREDLEYLFDLLKTGE